MAETMQRMTFRASVFREAGEWVAHCLDLDIVETGPTPPAAVEKLAEAIGAQLCYTREHDNFRHLYRPAPEEAWRKHAEIVAGPHTTILRAIDDSDRDVQVEAQSAAA